ncbi:MAG: PAS domain S-box protein, partial [Candidatus Thermoplasmatota archaeon]|nr:PAS domain S-box protein [Candidatus Thermoplasmatota archaeon]
MRDRDERGSAAHGSSGTGWNTVELATLFPSLFDAAPDGIVVVDPEGTILLANRQTKALFGYGPEELVGKKVEVLIPEAVREVHVGHRDAYMDNPQVRPMGANLDLQGVRKDGTEFPVEISLAPIHTPDDRLLVMAAVRDITERIEAERRFRDLLEAAPDAMILVEEDGRIVLVNQQTEDLFGYSRNALIGEPIETLIP